MEPGKSHHCGFKNNIKQVLQFRFGVSVALLPDQLIFALVILVETFLSTESNNFKSSHNTYSETNFLPSLSFVHNLQSVRQLMQSKKSEVTKLAYSLLV